MITSLSAFSTTKSQRKLQKNLERNLNRKFSLKGMNENEYLCENLEIIF